MQDGKTIVTALEYLPELDDQPLLTIRAEKKNEVELVLALAKKHKIPVIEDRVLASELAELEEGESLPTRLFKAVAALFNQIDSIISSAVPRRP